MTEGFFRVDQNGYEDLNGYMRQCVQALGPIIEDLNRAMQQMDVATQGSALPLWADAQNVWNKRYQDLQSMAQRNYNTSVNVAQIYSDGNAATQQIFMGG